MLNQYLLLKIQFSALPLPSKLYHWLQKTQTGKIFLSASAKGVVQASKQR